MLQKFIEVAEEPLPRYCYATETNKKEAEMEEKLLGIKELSAYLGISVNTAYSWVHQKRIPHIKLGRRVLFDPERVKEWMGKKAVEPDRWQCFLLGALLSRDKKEV